jgi:hypothetical protein
MEVPIRYMPPERPNQLKILVSDDELTMVRALAEQQGQTVADYLRLLIRREHAEIALAHLPRLTKPHVQPPKIVKRKPKK